METQKTLNQIFTILNGSVGITTTKNTISFYANTKTTLGDATSIAPIVEKVMEEIKDTNLILTEKNYGKPETRWEYFNGKSQDTINQLVKYTIKEEIKTLKLIFSGNFSYYGLEIFYENENENIEMNKLKFNHDVDQSIMTKKEAWIELQSRFKNYKLKGFKDFCLAYDIAMMERREWMKK